jgi:hypothetical protein
MAMATSFRGPPHSITMVNLKWCCMLLPLSLLLELLVAAVAFLDEIFNESFK